KPFWLAILAFTIIDVALLLISYQYDADRLTSAADLIVTYPQFCVFAKRAHDRNLPTWLIALFFTADVLSDLLTLAGYDFKPENYAPALIAIPLVIWGLFCLVLFVDLGFRRGTDGPNRFGPDPLAEGRPA